MSWIIAFFSDWFSILFAVLFFVFVCAGYFFWSGFRKHAWSKRVSLLPGVVRFSIVIACISLSVYTLYVSYGFTFLEHKYGKEDPGVMEK